MLNIQPIKQEQKLGLFLDGKKKRLLVKERSFDNSDWFARLKTKKLKKFSLSSLLSFFSPYIILLHSTMSNWKNVNNW